MGDWWLDETPYPGPPEPEPIDLEQIAKLLSQVGQRVGVGVEAVADSLKKSFRNFGFAYSEYNGHIHMHMDLAAPKFESDHPQLPLKFDFKPKTGRPMPPPRHVGPRSSGKFDRKGRSKF